MMDMTDMQAANQYTQTLPYSTMDSKTHGALVSYINGRPAGRPAAACLPASRPAREASRATQTDREADSEGEGEGERCKCEHRPTDGLTGSVGFQALMWWWVVCQQIASSSKWIGIHTHRDISHTELHTHTRGRSSFLAAGMQTGLNQWKLASFFVLTPCVFA